MKTDRVNLIVGVVCMAVGFFLIYEYFVISFSGDKVSYLRLVGGALIVFGGERIYRALKRKRDTGRPMQSIER